MQTRHISMRGLGGAASALALCAALAVTAAPSEAIPFRDDVGDEGAQAFAEPWDGVVQIYMWNRGTGGISFNCTGSMINPRTVLSAAHCFNSLPDDFYGTGGPLTPIIAYGPDTFDALFNWIDNDLQFIDERNGLSFALNVMTPEEGSFFGEPFPAADVAMLTTLDPLFTLPTYGMLFSPLTPEMMDEGVHVNMIGYGTFNPGSNSVGAGINGRRRAGENMLGFLGNFNHFFSALSQDPSNVFDSPADNQMMYWVDFTQPDPEGECARGPALGFDNSVICSDWDGVSGGAVGNDTLILPGPSLGLFPGEALPNEVGTAGGDSGGPLMAMNIFSNPLILGVLSGGFVDGSLHAAGQSYGKLSYYNPLFAYHQFISENNPYKYVTNTGGGDWFDESIWLQALDPNYYVIDENGEIVNGLPDGPELGTDPGDPWGVVFDTDVNDIPGAGEGGAAGIADSQDAANFASDLEFTGTNRDIRGGAGASGEADGGASSHATDMEFVAEAAPQNTGPGSTGFVPSNFYGVQGLEAPRFYDVTLAAPGTVSLGGAFVEIDRLVLMGDAELAVEADATLWSLISAETFGGTLRVDGGLITRETILWGGTVTGSGVIELLDPNFLFGNGQLFGGAMFNVGGMMRPGVAGADGAGALTLAGDYIQTAAGMYLVDWTADSAGRLDVIGSVSLDGMLGVNPEAGYLPRFGDTRRVMNWTGERVGEFAAIMDLPGVLFFRPTYGASFMDLTIDAESFVGFTTYENPAQLAIAGRLDDQRSSQSSGALAPIYASVDLLPGPQLTAAFENLVPHEAFQFRSTVGAHGSAFSSALRSRLTERPAEGGAPASAQAMFALMGSDTGRSMGGASLAAAARQADETGPQVTDAGNGIAVFFAGGVIDGSIRTSVASPRSGLEGGYAMAGIDYGPADGWRFGGMVGFASSETDQALPAGGDANGRTESIQGGVYAQYALDGWLAQVSAALGDHSSRTRRSAAIGAGLLSTGTLEASTTHLSAMAGRQFVRDQFVLTPSAGVDYTRYEFDSATQTGSAAALEIESQGRHEAVARAGVDVGYRIIGQGLVIEPRAYVGYAATLTDLDAAVNGDFAAAPGGTIVFDTGAKRDANWLDLSVGIVTRFDNGIELSGNYQTREADSLNLRTNVLSAGVRYRF